MSAIGGKADVLVYPSERLLMARSGHSAHEAIMSLELPANSHTASVKEPTYRICGNLLITEMLYAVD